MTRYVRFVLLTVVLVIALSLSSGVLIARVECAGYIVQSVSCWRGLTR